MKVKTIVMEIVIVKTQRTVTPVKKRKNKRRQFLQMLTQSKQGNLMKLIQ